MIRNVVKEKIRNLEAERNLLAEEKTNLEFDLAQLDLPQNLNDRIFNIVPKIRAKFSNASFSGMRELLELLEVKVLFYDLGHSIKLHVSCMLPHSVYSLLLEQFCPLVFGQRVMGIEPAFEGILFRVERQNPPGVFDGGVNFQSVADDAGVQEQPGAIRFIIAGNFLQIKVIISAAKVISFFENGDP
jgi:hypothetical protein